MGCDEFVFMGDFNNDLSNSFNRNNELFFFTMESFNMQQLINFPTRATQFSSTLIDYIIVFTDALVTSSGVIPVRDIADRSLVLCELDLAPSVASPTARTFRN